MNTPRIVQLRKKKGLDSIQVGQGNLNPKLYHQSHKDPSGDGVPMGDYRGGQILDSKHFIAPEWSDLKKQWAWGGTEEDLTRIIKAMRLRYPKNHKGEGQIIQPGNVRDRLFHFDDDVFRHPDLYGKYYLEDGRINFNLIDPKQEFLYFCYKGNPSVEDKSKDGAVNKYIRAGTQYELISPKKETKKKVQDALKEVKATNLISALHGDEPRIRAICEIMDLPQYSDKTESDGAWLLLKEFGAQNLNFAPKYNKTYQDRFIELAEMTDEDLNISHQVMKAKQVGIIRRRTGHYIFDGSRDGRIEVTSDTALIRWFRDPTHQEEYIALIDKLTEYTANKK